MCLIVFALECHPRYRLVLAANRDEYRRRPTEPAGFWPDAPHLLAGRDLQAGGTWLGITTGGRIAAVTNYRDAGQQVSHPRSRGRLVADFLRYPEMSAEDLRQLMIRELDSYDGFNLLYGSFGELHYFTNRGGSSGPIRPGIHGLSNHLLDTRWPKLQTARKRLEAIIRQERIDPEQLFAALADPAPFADAQLPDTGIGLERERLLSPLFITGTEYGTRSTTVVLVDRQGGVELLERSFAPPICPGPTLRFSFTVPPPPDR